MPTYLGNSSKILKRTCAYIFLQEYIKKYDGIQIFLPMDICGKTILNFHA